MVNIERPRTKNHLNGSKIHPVMVVTSLCLKTPSFPIRCIEEANSHGFQMVKQKLHFELDTFCTDPVPPLIRAACIITNLGRRFQTSPEESCHGNPLRVSQTLPMKSFGCCQSVAFVGSFGFGAQQGRSVYPKKNMACQIFFDALHCGRRSV